MSTTPAPIEFLLHAPTRAAFLEAMRRLLNPLTGEPLAVLDEAGAMVTSKGVSVDELGPVMKSAPEYDVDTGEEAKPAILIEGHHVNMRAEGELAALLLRMAEEGAGEGGGRGKSVVVGARSTGIFRDTGILSLLGNVAEVTKGDTKGVPRGFKGTTGITLFDPGDVTHRARVWA